MIFTNLGWKLGPHLQLLRRSITETDHVSHPFEGANSRILGDCIPLALVSSCFVGVVCGAATHFTILRFFQLQFTLIASVTVTLCSLFSAWFVYDCIVHNPVSMFYIETLKQHTTLVVMSFLLFVAHFLFVVYGSNMDFSHYIFSSFLFLMVDYVLYIFVLATVTSTITGHATTVRTHVRRMAIQEMTGLARDIIPFCRPVFSSDRTLHVAANALSCLYTVIQSTQRDIQMVAVANFVGNCGIFKPRVIKEYVEGILELFRGNRTIFRPEAGEFFTSWIKYKDSDFIVTVRKAFAYLVCLCFAQDFGQAISTARLSRFLHMDRDINSVESTLGDDMDIDIMASLCGVLQKVYDYGHQIVSGDYNGIFHCEKTYAEISERYIEIVSIATDTNAASDLSNDSKFLGDLATLITDVKNMVVKLSKKSNMLPKLTSDLRYLLSLQDRILVQGAANSPRPMPLSILLHGTPGVGKSFLTKMLRDKYAAIHGLDPEGYYVRDNAAKYWEGFNSAKCHTLVLDDILQIRADKDTTMSGLEFLQIINVVPFIVPMAFEGEKGHHPLKAKFVVATTNVKDIEAAASHFYNEPAAVARRFKYQIEVKVNEDYVNFGTLDLKHTLDNPLDAWSFTVTTPRLKQTDTRVTAEQIIVKFRNSRNILIEARDLKVDQLMICVDQLLRANDVDSEIAKALTAKLETFQCTDLVFLPEGSPNSGSDSEDHDSDAGSYCSDLNATFDACEIWPNVTEGILSREEEPGDVPTTVVELPGPEPGETDSGAHELPKPDHASMLDNPIVAGLVGRYVEREIFMPLNRCLSTVLQGGVALITLAAFAGIYKRITTPAVTKKETMAAHFSEERAPQPVRAPQPEKWHAEGNLVASLNLKGHVPEEESVWQDKMPWEPLPLEPSTMSVSFEDLSSLVEKNTFFISYSSVGGRWTGVQRMFGLYGSCYVSTAHSFLSSIKEDGGIMVAVIGTPLGRITSNTPLCRVPESCIYVDEPKDLIFFNLLNRPPVYDIRSKLLSVHIEQPVRGKIITRNAQGELQHGAMKGFIRPRIVEHFIPLDGRRIHAYAYEMEEDTFAWCGSPLIAKMPIGSAVLGIHCGRAGDLALALPLTRADVHVFKDVPVFVPQGSVRINFGNTKHALGPLHRKSTFRWMESGEMTLYGTFTGGKPSPKSRIRSTIARNLVEQQFFPVQFFAPNLKSWRAWNIGLEAICHKTHLNPCLAEQAQKMFLDEIFAKCALLPEDDFRFIQPVDRLTAINGVPGVKFVDAANRKTSCGFPFNCGKLQKLVLLENDTLMGDDLHLLGENSDRPVYNLDAEMEECFNHVLDQASRGVRSSPIFQATLKDEPVPMSKEPNRAGKPRDKVRIFSGCNFGFTLLTRMFYITTIKFIQEHHDIFECAVGINPESIEWQRMYQSLIAYGKANGIAGDHAHFDKDQEAAVLAQAFYVLKRFILRFLVPGFDRVQVENVLDTIATDTIFAFTNFCGDLVMFLGTMPSGCSLTTTINSIVNSLYMRIAFIALRPPGDNSVFSDRVNLRTYGDDNVMGVHPAAPWFNHIAIANFLDTQGLVYTTDKKEKPTEPYTDIDEVSFLKRRWVQHPGYPWMSCPMDEKSIVRSMSVWNRSKVETEEVQMLAIFDSANREYFQYGKETFLANNVKLEAIARSLDLHLLRKNPHDRVLADFEQIYESVFGTPLV